MQTVQVGDLFDQVAYHVLQARRNLYSRLTYAQFSGIVRYGPLQGVKLGDNQAWNPEDVASKLFGLYELEILNIVAGLRGQRRAIVNLGAADGYYGVGFVKNGMYERSVCFEITPQGQESIRQTAQLNGVADKVIVRGAAGPDFPKVVAEAGVDPADSVVISDIEGAEFSIFTPESAALQGAHIIIELHGSFRQDGSAAEQKLIADCQAHFNTSIVKMGARDLSSITELEWVNDSDRWLICSESRPKLWSWLVLSPK